MAGPDKTYPISGIPSDVKTNTDNIPYAPGMPSRREISDLFPSDDPVTRKQWTLMILAMNRFKAMGVEKKLSYFQVAGIHAYPLQPWDGAAPPPKDPTKKPPPGANPYGGYCQHNTITFPTWHRPYMLLFEKLVWTHMNDIIDEWGLESSLKAEWKAAADTWRLPYWDWARKQKYNKKYSLPAVLLVDQTTIYPPDKPEGQTGVENPFWGFSNPEKDNGKPRKFGSMPEGKTDWNIPNHKNLPWGDCTAISRYGLFSKDGKTFTGLDGDNNFKEANTTFSQFSANWYNPYKQGKEDEFEPPGTLADAVNRLFSPEYTDTWDTFASTKWWKESAQDVSSGYLSLEYIHNNVHNLTGGSNYQPPGKGDIGGYGLGHMSDVPVAAFDPVFWLHHCNIDRLLAMWQALHWDAWFDKPGFLDNGAASYPDPSKFDNLLPFHDIETDDPKTGYFTSEKVRDWTKLHYQYDDLKPKPEAILPSGKLNEERYKVDLLAHIHEIYPSTIKYYEKLFEDERIKNSDFFGPHNTQNVTWNDYIINVVYDRYALDGASYVIQFWLGGEDNKPDTAFKYEENLVGQVYSLGGMTPASDDTPGCANCGEQKDGEVLSRAQVPLTIPIISQALDGGYKHIDSTRGRFVEPYLMKHLHWKFVQIGGEERPASDFPNTTISVWRGTGKAQEPSEKNGKDLPPVYGGYQILYKPTDGKDCGLTHDDDVLGEAHKPHFHFRKL
ncbi:hypothetical protein FALBO_12005 [Fusarium albosuccineum]|uniref:tyrosinase n=1 Tax=Fusarium albosuccineum TaxID=1237068 RepID=A0A8H4L388_9HYPO|nr:hypothetical protein FALBO_12005 [Fusarium albosuccineum]